ncbi:MAG: ESCRT-0 subunit protein hse1 [Thelocarpon superellum]|nr:MAG: ESCRT-0 subunit protein hse1 [Thelocarpon superellum]
MFRAQQNAFDDVVAKATDENLTSENWEYIMDVCDKVASADTGAKDAVATMIKRLAHRNANVQLYTLELANALSQNCGPQMHRELASRSFTDALLRLANDRNTHQQVKAKILERMAEWTEMFSQDPDLGIMEQQYMKLKSQNPNLQPPSKPHKQEITNVDRQKEEEELQMALALSIKDKSSGVAAGASRPGPALGAGSSQSAQSTHPQPVPSGTTAATVSRVRALYDFQPSEPGELQFRKGDIIAVLESVYKDWWKGSLRGQTGIFPLNYVEKLSDPTQEELQREAQMEAEVFAEIKNVEKLLTLLSTSSSELDVQENEEITTLYHSTLAIRPKLIELIGKYSQRKDDFTQLNEKFIKARRDYENLLESSMSQPAQPVYGRPGQGQGGYGGYGGGPGYAPPANQGDPQRYYGPDGHQDPTQRPSSGPTPYYVASGQRPSSIPPAQQAAGRPPAGGAIPYRPPPQELATTSYDPPVDNRMQPQQQQAQQYADYPSHPPQPQHTPPGQAPGQEYSPSVYTPEDAPPLPTTSNVYPPAPSHSAPAPPAALQAGYPPAGAGHGPPHGPPTGYAPYGTDAGRIPSPTGQSIPQGQQQSQGYPIAPSQSQTQIPSQAPPQSQIQAGGYPVLSNTSQPPSQAQGQGQGQAYPAYSPAGQRIPSGGNPGDYYRQGQGQGQGQGYPPQAPGQGVGGGELFLPPGAQARTYE